MLPNCYAEYLNISAAFFKKTHVSAPKQANMRKGRAACRSKNPASRAEPLPAPRPAGIILPDNMRASREMKPHSQICVSVDAVFRIVIHPVVRDEPHAPALRLHDADHAVVGNVAVPVIRRVVIKPVQHRPQRAAVRGHKVGLSIVAGRQLAQERLRPGADGLRPESPESGTDR